MKRRFRKSLNGIIVATTIFSFGATPALASEPTSFIPTAEPVTAIAHQELSTLPSTSEAPSIENLLELATSQSGPETGFNVEVAINLAKSELGTSRATGWSMPGECIISAKRWITAAGGNWTTEGTPRANYDNAEPIPFHLVQPGDIIQYENIYAPHAWVTGVHTMMVTAVNADGTLDIIQSNVPMGSGLVTEEKNWLPQPPEGFQTAYWRF